METVIPTVLHQSRSPELPRRVSMTRPSALKMLLWCVLFSGWRFPRSLLIGVPEVFWQAFHRAIALLGVETPFGKQVPYALRHTGASVDAWAQRRSLTEIQGRGRWKSAGSARRYAKGGRVAHQLSACWKPLQRVARLCVAALADALVRLQPPLRAPAFPHGWTPSASCSLTRLIGCPKPLP